MKSLRIVGVTVFLMVSSLLFACQKTGAVEPKTKWDVLLEKYADDSSVNQIVFVKCTGGYNANVEFYVKHSGKWTFVRSEKGSIGENGLGKTKEGDKMTPEGDFGIGKSFGIFANPGTSLEYIDVVPGIFACDEDCEYYNRIIDTAAVHHNCKGEDMITKVSLYNYGFQIGYNTENIYPLGSNIFFHCTPNSLYPTMGCVAVSEDFVKEILMKADKGMKVCIHQEQ